MQVQAVLPERAVKRFNERVLGRLALLDEVQLHVILYRPEEHGLAGELRPIVTDQCPRTSPQCVQVTDHPGARDRAVDDLTYTLPVEVIDDVQHPEASLSKAPYLARLKALAELYPRYGYPTLHAMLKREGLVENRKRTYRIYSEERLQVRTKQRKKLIRPRVPLAELARQYGCTKAS